MSPDELRALADALEPMSAAPRFDCLPVVEFCAWLRQCADAKPVAWLPAPQPQPKCWCRACLTPVELMSTFVVCPQCGNKRCPRAEDHRNACTNSNETEAQIEARDALLDFISENGTISEGVQHYLDRYVRAALAAKQEK